MEQALAQFGRRFEQLQELDADRNKLTKDLLAHLVEVAGKLQQTELDLQAERNERRGHQQANQLLEGQMKALEKKPFAVVIIDADAESYTIQFHNKFLSAGGEQAADELLKRTRDYLKSVTDYSGRLEIIVKAFANLDGLSSALVRDGRIRDEKQFRQFVASFNSRSSLFDFLDVGPGRERADQKIRESLKFYVDIPQCKHILFACCHDSGYAPFLGQFIVDPSIVERITLLEGSFVALAIKQLGFTRHTQFPSVFMTKDYVCGRSSPGQQTKKFFYAVPSRQQDKLASSLENFSGRRVDVPLSVEERVLKELRPLGLCHWLFLRGECKGCPRNHQYRQLTDSEFDALWYISRQGFCHKAKRGVCDDSMCIYGHSQ